MSCLIQGVAAFSNAMDETGHFLKVILMKWNHFPIYIEFKVERREESNESPEHNYFQIELQFESKESNPGVWFQNIFSCSFYADFYLKMQKCSK